MYVIILIMLNKLKTSYALCIPNLQKFDNTQNGSRYFSFKHSILLSCFLIKLKHEKINQLLCNPTELILTDISATL